MAGVLEGFRVLDLSWGIAGPISTMLLADNGAEVTRIERPGGDPFASSSGYVVWNRGKSHTTIDLTDGDGRAEFHEMVGGSDVVVQSFSPSAAERLGVDGPTLRALNPALIVCSITGYGNHSKHRDRPGYDALVAARTGLFYDQRGRSGAGMEYILGRPGPNPEFGSPDGLRRGTDRPGPVFPRSTFPSHCAALLATLGISAALRARQVTGVGQDVSTSLLQGVLLSVAATWQRVENPDHPLYWMWPVDSRSIEGLFECADGRWVHHWTIRPNWVRAAAAGDSLESFDTGHDYRSDPDRLGMGPEDMLVGHFLYPDLVEAFKRFDSTDWERVGEASEMGIAQVRSVVEALSDESYVGDGCVVEREHPEHGPIRHVGNVLEFDRTPGPPVGTICEGSGALDRSRIEGTTEKGPLDGVRVLDLGLGIAGPWNPRMLADLGADVIKVNSIRDSYWTGTHMGLATNRGKRSIALDLKHPRGLEVLHRLIDTADVLATNWRPGAMARLGIDEESLRANRPDLVICNSRGFEKGPRSDLPGTDQTAAALTGVEWEDGACSAGNPPLWSRSGMGDTGNAMLSAIAIILALVQRGRTGEGQSVSTSIVNASLLSTSYAWINSGSTNVNWEQVDAEQWGIGALYRIYPTSDGFVTIAVIADDQWECLTSAITALGDDARFVGAAREEHDDALAEVLGAWFAARTSADSFASYSAGVPIEVVNETFCRELFEDDEARALGYIAESQSAAVGRFEDPGMLVNLSATPGSVQRGPSACGEHSRELLIELGYDDSAIAELEADKVTLAFSPT